MTIALEPPVVIQLRAGRASLGLAEPWRHHELAGLLALRNVRVDHDQSWLGSAWVVLQPLATLAVFGMPDLPPAAHPDPLNVWAMVAEKHGPFVVRHAWAARAGGDDGATTAAIGCRT